MNVPEENLLAMKRHNMEGVERDGGILPETFPRLSR